jgi:hypothetical protein
MSALPPAAPAAVIRYVPVVVGVKVCGPPV